MLQWALHSDMLPQYLPHLLHMDHCHSLEFHSVQYRCTPTCGAHRQSSHWQSEVSTEIEKKHVTWWEVTVTFYFKYANQNSSGAQCTRLYNWIACVSKLRRCTVRILLLVRYIATLGTHSNDVPLLLLDLLRQLIGCTPVSGVCTGNLCLHKDIHSIQLLCNHFLWLMRQLSQPCTAKTTMLK